MKGIFPIKDISGISGHIGAIFPIWRIKGVVFQSPKWNHMRSCLLIRLALDLTHVMGIWLINRAFHSYTHWPPDPAQRGHCFPFANEVDVGVFLRPLQVCDILFLFKSLKSERTKLSETPAGKYRRQSEPLEKKFVFPLPREAGEDRITSQLEAWRRLQLPPPPARGFPCHTCRLAVGLTPTLQKPPLLLSGKERPTDLGPHQECPQCSSSLWKKLFLEEVGKEAKCLLFIHSYLQGSTFTHITTFNNLPWTRDYYVEHLLLKLFVLSQSCWRLTEVGVASLK